MKSKIHEYLNIKQLMSRNLLLILAVLCVTFSFAQTNQLDGKVSHNDVKLKNLDVTVTVDSVEEIESTFTVKDIKSILKETGENEAVSFKIICNGKKMSNGVKSHVSYKATGNTNDINGFLKSVKKIRKSAIKYYKAK